MPTKPLAFQPSVQPLDPRIVPAIVPVVPPSLTARLSGPAATATFDAATGGLTIDGSSQADNIQIGERDGVVTVDGVGRVTGPATSAGLAFNQFRSHDVKTVNVFGNGGDDTLSVRDLRGTFDQWESNSSSNRSVPRSVMVSGGGGRDTITGGDAVAALLGGDGDDRIVGGSGAERIDGGDGTDRAIIGPGDSVSRVEIVSIPVPGGDTATPDPLPPRQFTDPASAKYRADDQGAKVASVFLRAAGATAATEPRVIASRNNATSFTTSVQPESMPALLREFAPNVVRRQATTAADAMAAMRDALNSGRPVLTQVAAGVGIYRNVLRSERLPDGRLQTWAQAVDQTPKLEWVAITGYDATTARFTVARESGRREQLSAADLVGMLEWIGATGTKYWSDGVGERFVAALAPHRNVFYTTA